MLENVTTVKAKPETIVCRVASDLKEYVIDAADKLNVSASAYVIQLIENDRKSNSIVLNMDDDVAEFLTSLKDFHNDKTFSDTINRIVKERLIVHED